MTTAALAALAFAFALGCGGEPRESPPDSAAPPAAAPAADTAVIASTGGASTAKPICPATGRWAPCSVVERLERAGLAPRVDSARASEDGIAFSGTLVLIGRSELELYFFADNASRERAQSGLDRGKYLGADAAMGMTPQPTLIGSVNLIAILHSRNDHQRERVADAILSGPPQPPTRP